MPSRNRALCGDDAVVQPDALHEHREMGAAGGRDDCCEAGVGVDPRGATRSHAGSGAAVGEAVKQDIRAQGARAIAAMTQGQPDGNQ